MPIHRGKEGVLLVSLVLAISAPACYANSPVWGVHGVHPTHLAQYDQPTHPHGFKCLDGSITVKWDKVNDDYCDCPDASDEPGTSACMGGNLYCRNRGHTPLVLDSSFVNDGICDCCDGADENNGRLKCTNTCMELGASKREELNQLALAAEMGVAARSKYVETAAQSKREWDQAKAKVDEEVAALKPLVDVLKAKKRSAEKATASAKARKDAIKEAKQKAADTLLGDAASSETAETATDSVPSEEEPITEVSEQREETEEERGQRIAAQWTTNAESAGETEMRDVSEDAAPSDDDESSEDDADLELGDDEYMPQKPSDWDDEEDGVWEPPDEAREDFGEGEDYDDYDHHHHHGDYGNDHDDNDDDDPHHHDDDWEDHHDSDGAADEGDEVGETDNANGDHAMVYEHNEFDTDDDDDVVGDDNEAAEDENGPEGRLVRAFRKIAWFMEPVTDPFKRLIDPIRNTFGKLFPTKPRKKVELVRKEFDEQNDKLTKLQSEQTKLEKKLANDYGPEQAFLPLATKCIATKVNQYTYEVCPFENAAQKEGGGSTQLGNWGGFTEGYSKMTFTGGATCWNGPARSLTVSLVCGHEDALSKVEEPAKCEYTAQLKTPAACTEAIIADFKAQIVDMEGAHDEL